MAKSVYHCECPVCGNSIAVARRDGAHPASTGPCKGASCEGCGKQWEFVITQRHNRRMEVYANDGEITYELREIEQRNSVLSTRR